MLTINLFNGLVYGALLIVMCSGLALIYGLRRVVNFAHGSLYMLGAYLGYSISLHSNFWVALVAAPAIMALLGVLLDRYGFRLLQDRDPLTVVLVTFGLLLVIEDLVQTTWGKSNLSVPVPEALAFSIDLAGTPVPAYRLCVILIGAAVALGFAFAAVGLTVHRAFGVAVLAGAGGSHAHDQWVSLHAPTQMLVGPMWVPADLRGPKPTRLIRLARAARVTTRPQARASGGGAKPARVAAWRTSSVMNGFRWVATNWNRNS